MRIEKTIQMLQKKRYKKILFYKKMQKLQIKVYRKIDTNVLKNQYKQKYSKTRYNKG